MTVLSLDTDKLVLNVPRPEFCNTYIDGWSIGSKSTRAGQLYVSAWSDEQIAEWRETQRRWDRYGRRFVAPARRFGRRGTGGLSGMVARRCGIPLSLPGTQPTMISNCRFSA